jgi:hypothetical protein
MLKLLDYSLQITSCTSWCSLPWKQNAVSRTGFAASVPHHKVLYEVHLKLMASKGQACAASVPHHNQDFQHDLYL